MDRDRYVDFLRALAICLVVLGHWLITALVREPGGGIVAPELLAEIPWTQWLTLGFQIMPLFFLAGGHAAGGSWSRTRAAGGAAAPWVARRALRLLLPTAAYCGLVLLAVAVCSASGVDRPTLQLAGWAMAMQFWFLPVYLLLSALTPLLHRAHRRWGLRVPVVMGAVAVAADALVLWAGAPAYTGLLNYLLVWGMAYQLGFCWRDGQLTRRRGLPSRATPAAMALGGAFAFTALITFGPYPVSLIRVTGETVGNTDPPSAAMLAWVVAQVGACLLAAPVVRRALERERVWRAVRFLGGASMTFYLWHMLPVLLAAVFYLVGLAPDTAFGTPAWWALRAPWLVLLAVFLGGVMILLRPLERALTRLLRAVDPAAGGLPRRSEPLWLGLACGTVALAFWAVYGFAPDGRFPVLPALGFAVGVALVALPRDRAAGAPRPGEGRKAAEEAA
ncbi:acyltransferase [Streptomyces sp. NPDC026673]|uniref:acyltransferase family protein n=1 Tax=Streptomyces sp. NPDC026673 TaxID=3155724 RepID=UPI00340E48FF